MIAEGLHAHGFHSIARELAVELANTMLRHPPNLTLSQDKVRLSQLGFYTCQNSNFLF